MTLTADDYEYRDLVASTWDFLRGDTSEYPDREYFRNFIVSAGDPGLIVGCGTGRLVLDYASQGLDVDGLDVSPEMASICESKARRIGMEVTVHVQAMECMNLERKYQSIVVPSSSFQLVSDLVESQRALSAFFDHLVPGGRLIMSLWQIKETGALGWTEWYLVAEKGGFEADKTIRRWERSKFDPKTQLRHTENRYEVLAGGQLVREELHQRSPELRSFSPSELSGMMQQAGFLDVETFSGFSLNPASEDDEVFCIVGTRK